MPEILFPAYRSYAAGRVEVNDAMNALLVGSRLAAHTLSLTTGTSATLGQIFPAVEHIDRYNMKSDVARDFLSNADHHIASVAIPYALATHEDYIDEVLSLLESNGRTLNTPRGRIKAWNMHSVVFDACGAPEPGAWMEVFHTIRELRNCITHAGGVVDQRLREAVASMGGEARNIWGEINHGQFPELIEGAAGRLELTAENMFTAFAVTKHLGREVNRILGDEFNEATWADIAVKDFDSQTKKAKNSQRWRRGLSSFVQQNYGPLKLPESQLEVAAREFGGRVSPGWG